VRLAFSAAAVAAKGTAASRGFRADENDPMLIGDVFANPNATVNAAGGRTFFDRGYVGKIAGAFDLPGRVSLGIVTRYQDGQPFSRLAIFTNLNQGPEAVMAYSNGRPTTFERPRIVTRLRSMSVASTPVESTPRIASTSDFVTGCLYAMIAIVQVGLFRTRWGLRVRAVGEHPAAADTVGINVLWTRYRNVILGGLIAGIGGAFLTIGQVGSFGKDMSSGQGYIALAAMIFGRWTPLGATAAALLFGFATSLQSILGTLNVPIPSNILLMAPYVVTIVAVAGLVGKVRAPKADGQPYVKA